MKELISNLPELLRFIDAHDLTPEQMMDSEYIQSLVDNFNENKLNK